VARALAGKPAILLADEPTGNLDSRNGEAVMELLKEFHAVGATICMVTHDERFAQHADRTVHLFDGLVVEDRIAALRSREVQSLLQDLRLCLRMLQRSRAVTVLALLCFPFLLVSNAA